MEMLTDVFWFLKWQWSSCCSCRELQAASGEWLKEAYASCEAVDHLSTTDVLRKSIRRSWTISSECNTLSC